MRYDTPIYFQKVTQGEYDPTNGDYGEDTVDETCVMASVMDTSTETMQIVYGSIKQRSKTIHIQNHYDKSYDSIRIDNKIYRGTKWVEVLRLQALRNWRLNSKKMLLSMMPEQL